MSTRFSILIVDYDGSVNRQYMQRAVQSVLSQSIDKSNYEIILLHDGPKQEAYEKELSAEQLQLVDQIIITEQRHNDWGHTLRDQGIRQAKGEYIIHLNADNILYPHALERLAYHADKDFPPIFDNAGAVKNNNDILIFSVYMMGVVFCNGGFSRRPGQEHDYSVILTGMPTKYRNIDCMQLVMKREKWLEQNGWYDKSRNSDGIMYPKFAEQYGARYIPELLGEHW